MTTADLLEAAADLNFSDLDQFVSQVIQMRARRQTRVLPKAEADLLLRINQGIPGEIKERYDRLCAGRDDESLTTEEYAELLRLSDEIETVQARRIQDLADLADIRKVPLTKLMEEIGIQPPSHE
ncbi:MAG: STAS/SEC14 domain-containing protein [Proteobacteria bacterium]|nr:STAS/SEC14 domain-containing protein [Pseudomonadota bacterium]